MAAKQQQQQQNHLQQSSQQQQLVGSSRFVGLSPQDYPQLATAASFNSPTKKWALNSKKDVVELQAAAAAAAVVGAAPQFLESNHLHLNLEGHHPQHQQGFMGECGRGLMRYNSAPSCLFSDLEQIARSLSSDAQMFDPQQQQQQQQLPPLPMMIDKQRGTSPNSPKKKNGAISSGGPSTSRFSSAQSSVVSLGMEFDQDQPQQQQSNGFTGLLTGSSPMKSSSPNHHQQQHQQQQQHPLARQSSSPASLMSRLEIEHCTGSSDDESPLMRSPINDQEASVVDCAYWSEGANVNPPPGVAAATVAAQQAAAAAVAAAQLHHHHQQIHHQSPVFVNGGSSDSNRKRVRDMEMDIVEAASLEHHNQQQHQQQHTLTRHLSLPIPSRSNNSLLAAENLLQDSVPCRLRAKRGCATHPRSIAERVRRTRISERMRRLQELVPNMDKQTNMSDMLDEAAEYMKFLQKKVEDLEDCREKCQGLCKMSQSALNHPS